MPRASTAGYCGRPASGRCCEPCAALLIQCSFGSGLDDDAPGVWEFGQRVWWLRLRPGQWRAAGEDRAPLGDGLSLSLSLARV